MSSYSMNWNYPTPTRFGPGRISELPDACRELGISSPLLVTDRGVAPLPITQRAVDICQDAGLEVGVFGEVNANPAGEDVLRGNEAFRSGGHDGVIAFGGGSALDVAKAVALAAHQERPMWDFEDAGDNWRRVNVAAMHPVVAVPTTSGTGSEVGRCSVIVNEEEQRKVILFHARMLPERVICDPELTVGLPPSITAGVGMDALAHNLEAYLAPGFHPMADGIAVEGMRLVKSSLVRAVRQGGDIAARSEMMAAALMGATAFQKGLGAIHALSHPVGAKYGSHHGTANAVFMPYVLEFNRPAVEARVVRLARYLGLADASYDGFLAWVMQLREAVGIPHTSDAIGVTAEDIPALAEKAAVDPTAPTNPVPLNVQNLTGLFERSLRGQLGA